VDCERDSPTYTESPTGRSLLNNSGSLQTSFASLFLFLFFFFSYIIRIRERWWHPGGPERTAKRCALLIPWMLISPITPTVTGV
jgi:hypothetical protein